jgi:hypothetical protein
MRDGRPDALECLALEARWHSVATAVVLPTVLMGRVSAAVLAFGLFEAGLATARWRGLRSPRSAAAAWSR